MSDPDDTKTPIKNLRREMSSFGAARSLISQALSGGNVISSGVRALTDATKKSLEPGRYETFDGAMERLCVNVDSLPIIHNQLVIQVYLTFFVTCISFASCANLIFQTQYFPGFVAMLIGVASVTKMIQSSVQCEFIRERRLGIMAQWMRKPSVWLPDRIEGLMKMTANDPLREPKVINPMVKNSRRHFKYAAVMLVLTILSFAIFGSLGWPLVSFTCAAIFVLLGSSLSFEVYKRRHGIVCDLFPWLSSPRQWIPSLISTKKASMPKEATD